MALKEGTVQVDSLNGSIKIRELSARAQIEIIEAQDKPFEGVFIALRYGVPEWSGRQIDDLKDTLTLTQATELAGHIFALSGTPPEKN